MNIRTYYTKVVGVTYENRQAIIATLKGNEPCRLQPEPDNKFDPNAVAVWVATPDDVKHIGYLKREFAAIVAPRMDGESLMCEIDEITGGFETRDGGTASYGVNLKIEIPEDSDN